MRRNPLFVILLTVAACETNPYATVSDEALHANAKSLALPERYDLYVRVLESRTPRRPILAEDVAALGDPAWQYVVGRALRGGSAELSQALPVLYAFDRPCGLSDLERLREHADRVSSGDTARALKSSIDSLCGSEMPAAE